MRRINRKGFTLIELLAVIVILAIVLIVTIPSVITSINTAKEKSLVNATATVTEWFTKQYELSTLGVTVSAETDAVYTTWVSSNLDWISSAKDLDESILKAAGITDPKGLTGTAKLTNGKICIKLTAGQTSQFYNANDTNKNKATGSGCLESSSEDEANQTNQNAATYITSLYTNADKSTVTNGEEGSEITYNYASSVSLMNDRLGGTTTSLDGGNIRYYGEEPYNYIYFNCSDYNNQTSDTCELWRIIGVFDGKLKLMRNDEIGGYSWDTSDSTINSGHGINEWSQADLMKLLNPGYESEEVGGSLYYNSTSGTCYNEEKNATTSCNFTETGIKNDETRNKIAMVTWNTGGWNSSSVYSNLIYEKERGTEVLVPGTCSYAWCNDTVTRQTTWEGKIALAYPSDYGYATDFTKCSETLWNYDSSTDFYACRTNDWMYPIVTNNGNNDGWLLAPTSDSAYYVWHVDSTGYVNYNYFGTYAFYALGASPTLFLNANEVISSGDGTLDSPYRLNP